MGTYNQALNDNIDNVKVNKNVGSGGGGGETTYTRELLYEHLSGGNETITLSKQYNEFDEIVVICYRTADGRQNLTPENVYNVDNLHVNDYLQMYGWAGTSEWLTFQLTDVNTLTFVGGGSENLVARKVYGIKY